MSSSGPNSPGTLDASSSAAGGGSSLWSNASNAGASDNSYATCSQSSASIGSFDLKATNFGFSIPGGSTINGIVVEVERKSSVDSGSNFTRDKLVKLIKGGSVSGTDKADTSTHHPTADAYATYGGVADLWGLTLTDSDVNASNFGVCWVSQNGPSVPPKSGRMVSVDHIRITVYYTAGGGGSSVKTLAAMGVG